MSKSLQVAVGLVLKNNYILISKRLAHVDHGGYWEFPGGKINPDETPYEGLCRELREEINLDVIDAEPFSIVTHQYPKYSVVLHIFLVNDSAGIIKPLEGQMVKWVDFKDLKRYRFPNANYLIIDKLKQRITPVADVA